MHHVNSNITENTVSPWIKQRLCEQLLGALAECDELAGNKNTSFVQIAATFRIRQLPHLRWQNSVSSKRHPTVSKTKEAPKSRSEEENIATGEMSQAITSFHFFDYFNFSQVVTLDLYH